jgi:SpoVK/Ycf46/Vps4 family AAA+-type ATPase
LQESKQDNLDSNYKFREIKTYSSTEWLADNKKRYRQVFDVNDTSYIYAELAIINKEFDRSNWDLNVKLVCYEHAKKKKICTLEINKVVTKNEHIVYLREGWGHKKKGAFWKEGTYFWEAWIGDKKIGTKYFYVEDFDFIQFDLEENHFLKSAKLYEGQFDDMIKEERKYMKVFSEKETRYIHIEFTVNNIFPHKDWHSEIFIKFFNEVKEVKGQIIKLQKILQNEDEIEFTAGWGSNLKGSWRAGEYTVEIMFLDKVMGVIPFEIDEEFEEGLVPIHFPYSDSQYVLEPGEELTVTFKEVLAELEKLVGLEEIKTKVKEHAEYLKFLKLRKEKGFKEKATLDIHSVFLGNPGTGKTTVAKMMGQLYKKMGLLSKGHVTEVDRGDLVGEYIGQTAPKVKAILQKARGGVLFIDEAYSLARSAEDNKDFGKEVIEMLVKEMSNGPGDIAIIVAGYPAEMKNFMASNPGLKSRFKHKFNFRDYMPSELLSIAKYAAEDKEIILNDPAITIMEDIIQDAYRERDKSFGNARFVNDILDKAKLNLALRVMLRKRPEDLSRAELSTILPIDMINLNEKRQSKVLPNLKIDYHGLELALKELDSLIDIEEVKKEVKETVDIVKYYKESGRLANSSFSMHTVLVGNPGTGKSTVARILAKIYKALGVLDRGHLVETDRQGLVAGFIGQTAIKTNEKIDEAMGGVLFIDEAYALSNSNGLQGDYGNEAIQTLLKKMEDHRGEFFVFVAGYPDNMKKFLEANPGLSSRFDKTLVFPDYNAAKLLEIAEKMMADNKYKLKKQALQELSKMLTELYASRDKYFGNARTVRKIVLDIIKNQNIRISKLPKAQRTTYKMKYIELEDIQRNIIDANMFEDRKKIGY